MAFFLIPMFIIGVSIASDLADDAAEIADAAQRIAVDASATAAAAREVAAHAASIYAKATTIAAAAESLAASFATIALCAQVVAVIVVFAGLVYIEPKIRNASILEVENRQSHKSSGSDKLLKYSL